MTPAAYCRKPWREPDLQISAAGGIPQSEYHMMGVATEVRS